MKNLQDFFLFCSGVESTVLEKCPTDRNKYAGIGATVFFTGVLAFFSSGYALFTVFDSYAMAGVFGLIWGLMIFNLDRYIVMSMKRNGKWGRDFMVAFPRLLMAVLKDAADQAQIELNNFVLENQPLIREKELAAQQFEQSTQKDIAQLDRGR